MSTTTETAIFAAGCFWGVQDILMDQPGVISTEAGYIGGHTENPTYEDVCYKSTGHAEAVKVIYDPSIVSFSELLDVFWRLHDPTQVNRQGPDVGDQYRSAIFTTSEAQMAEAQRSKEAQDASGEFEKPIATEIVPAGTFYPAEDYHQQYFKKTGRSGCHILRPKKD